MDQLSQMLPIDLTKKIVTDNKAVEDFMHEGDVMIDERKINLTINEGLEIKLSNLKEHLMLPDDMSVIRLAVSLYSKLVDANKSGKEVRIRHKDGTEYNLEFEKGT